MGNRAVITTPEKTHGIYVHWNGGPESVLAFCQTAKELGYRDPAVDPSYSMARLTGLIALFFGIADEGSVGTGPLSQLDCDNWDNGVYVVGKNWEIVERYGHGSSNVKTEEQLGFYGRRRYYEICQHLRRLVNAAIYAQTETNEEATS